MRAGAQQLAGGTLPPVTESNPVCYGVRSPGLHPTRQVCHSPAPGTRFLVSSLATAARVTHTSTPAGPGADQSGGCPRTGSQMSLTWLDTSSSSEDTPAALNGHSGQRAKGKEQSRDSFAMSSSPRGLIIIIVILLASREAASQTLNTYTGFLNCVRVTRFLPGAVPPPLPPPPLAPVRFPPLPFRDAFHEFGSNRDYVIADAERSHLPGRLSRRNSGRC